MSISEGFITGIAFGALIGVALGVWRVSGVDFRQWFRDPGQLSDMSDDSWIGLARNGAYAVAGAAFITWLVALWRVHGHPWGLASGFIVGFIGSQLIAECAWRLGLAMLPQPQPPRRLLARNRPAASHPRPDRQRGRRRLVICCDGTWNWPATQRETNVVRLLRAITPVTKDEISQITYYHLGVGTGNFVDRIAGGAAGVGLSNSVKACYGFLADNYQPEDEIFLFGFSRGAYVARSVAGMVGTVGILRKHEMARFYEMWDWYVDQEGRSDVGVLDEIAPERHPHVDIECIGVWDTVGALGIPGVRFCSSSFAFHETELGEHVHFAFQALAMDERRGNFQGAVWVPKKGAQARSRSQIVQHVVGRGEVIETPAGTVAEFEIEQDMEISAVDVPKHAFQQVLEQVWFPGVHSNIGGGYEQHGLSDTALIWMISRLEHWKLLDINLKCIDDARDLTEVYGKGRLLDSRTFGWRLVGSPVPRAVGVTWESEKIHESAWERIGHAHSTDEIYGDKHRKAWLTAMADRKIERSPFERKHAVTERGSAGIHPPMVSSKLGFCDRFMQFFGGNA